MRDAPVLVSLPQQQQQAGGQLSLVGLPSPEAGGTVARADDKVSLFPVIRKAAGQQAAGLTSPRNQGQ